MVKGWVLSESELELQEPDMTILLKDFFLHHLSDVCTNFMMKMHLENNAVFSILQ